MSSPFAFGSTSTSRTTESGRVMWHNMVNAVFLSHTVQDRGETVPWLTRLARTPLENKLGQVYEALLELKDPPLRYLMSDSRIIPLNRLFWMIRSNWFAKRLFHTRRRSTIYVQGETKLCYSTGLANLLHYIYKQLNFKSWILQLKQLNSNYLEYWIITYH